MAELTVPQIDFSSLGQLPGIWKQGRSDAMRQQTLASLGQGTDVDANSLLKSGDLSLAQLGVAMRNRSSDDIWRQQEAMRAQQNADRSYGLQSRAADRADEGVPEKAAERAKAATQYGLTPDMPAFKSFVLTGKLPEADTSVVNEVNQRRAAAEANGLKPDNPGYQSFILTGKMPREDAQPLTAGDKEAIRTADDAVIGNKAAIDSLTRAKELSKLAFAGPAAGARGYAASFLGESSDLGKGGQATENLTNEVMTNALGQLKAIFGGNPTEGERKILLDLQGSVSKPDSVRQAIFDRAIGLAQKRLEFNQQRADQLRGGTYYKQGGAKPAPPATAQPSQGNGADTMLAHAREAIAAGAPREAVLQRLQQSGVDASGL